MKSHEYYEQQISSLLFVASAAVSGLCSLHTMATSVCHFFVIYFDGEDYNISMALMDSDTYINSVVLTPRCSTFPQNKVAVNQTD